MRKIVIAVCIVMAVSSAPASSQQREMPAIDRELWDGMAQAFGAVSMPLPAHQQVQQIMQNAEREALSRQMQKKSLEARPDSKAAK